MKDVACFALLMLALLALAGCSDAAPGSDQGVPSDHGAAEVGPDAAVPDAAQPDVTDNPDAPPGARVCATLLESAGAAVPDTNAIVCDGAACNMATSDASGALCVAVDAPGVFKFNSFERIAGGKHYGEVLFPLTVTQQQIDVKATLDLGQVVVPLMGQTVVLDAKLGGVLALGGGVSLQVPAGSASQPSLSTAIDVAAAQVAPKDLHARLLATGPGGKVLAAAFHLVPSEVVFAAPVGFSLPGGGLSPGAALLVYGVDHDTGKLEPRGEAVVDGLGQITSQAGQGLTTLGWFLFYRK